MLIVYIAGLLGLFLYFRTRTWTDEEAAPIDRKPLGFGRRIGLSKAFSRFVAHGGTRILIVTCLAAVVVRISMWQWSWLDVAVTLAVLAFWPMQEWIIHAQLEHVGPIQIFGKEFEMVLTRTHRAHHRNPWDPRFGLTTTHLIVVLLGGVPLVWIGPAAYFGYSIPTAMSGVAVTFLLILNYEWIHFLIHTSYQPRTRWYRRLWMNHRLHHFENENYWFGLTMLSGDWALRTQPEQGVLPRSPTCLNLGVASDLVKLTSDHGDLGS